LNDWAAFYGHDLQGALALADKGKIPMWFTLAYALERNGKAVSELKQAFKEAFEPIVNSLENGLERIARSFRGERIP
jgi:CRISPR/Cas system CSM-associated protein Csm2 small subunit